MFRRLLFIATILVLGAHLIHAAHDALVPYRSDTYIYLAVGRGILNGLTPYVDLFETKPPAMFLLSALSLKIFDDGRLLLFLGSFLMALLPLCIVWPLWKRGERRLDVLLGGLVFGALLARLTAEMSGGGITESLAATFAAAIPAVWYATHGARSTRTLALLGLLLFCAIFLKEPFLLSAIAGVLIVTEDWKSMRRGITPMIVAGVILLIVLLIAGYLTPYLKIYLPHMLGFKINYSWGSASTPLWLRSIDIWEIVTHLWSFSKIFTLLTGVLWICGGWILWMRDRISGILRWLVASWLTTLAVGLSGDYYTQHFVFAVPLFAALVLLVLPMISDMHRRGGVILLSIIALSCIVLSRDLLPIMRSRAWNQYEGPAQTAATVIDDIMDRCEMDRYLLLVGRNHELYGLTHHSPYGPVFVAQRRIMGSSEEFTKGFIASEKAAQILVMKTEEDADFLQSSAWPIIRMNFLQTPPACAGAIPEIEPYHLLFRKTSEATDE